MVRKPVPLDLRNLLTTIQGSVIRVGPNELSFADPGAVRAIYNSDVFIKEESFYVNF
jgi:benzoate 4-monooxygenase